MLDWRDRRAEGHLGAEADCVITVSEPLGRWLQDTYGWAVVNIVRNTFPAFPTSPKDVQPYALLYAGRVDKERDLDTVINGAARHGELKVVIRGNGDAATIRRIEAGGVIVEPARPVDELVADYRRCGIGVVSLTGDSFNHDVALPNKLFHAVQAGVPIIASDLPAIRSVVEEHGIGECYSSGDPDSFAAAITRLLSSYDEKLAAVANAKEALSWAHDKRILVDLYREINR
jgi:glycosyltransferase involved in cell wall biosynthesis